MSKEDKKLEVEVLDLSEIKGGLVNIEPFFNGCWIANGQCSAGGGCGITNGRCTGEAEVIVIEP